LVDREPTIARGIMEALVARIRRLEAEAAARAAGTD
jgi:uncharacterized protein (UPF0335 family)